MRPRTASAPSFIEPQLCKLVGAPPTGRGWLHEIKFDGYRMQVRVERSKATIRTRRGYDWTERFPQLARSASKLPDCVLDGELCALGPDGKSDFAALVASLNAHNSMDLTYCVFDCLWREGRDLRSMPFVSRKAELAELLATSCPNIQLVTHIDDGGANLLTAACRMGLEGVVSKQMAGTYRSGPTGSWLKSKCRPVQEFVVGGWTETSSGFKALLVGHFEGSRLMYAGKVGTGYSSRVLEELMPKLGRIEVKTSPFSATQPTSSSTIHWVKPQLVAQVAFATWTSDNLLRQASFQGLRADKPVQEVVREDARA